MTKTLLSSGLIAGAVAGLVMAAWLAYLKSRLMVPQVASDDEPTGEGGDGEQWDEVVRARHGQRVVLAKLGQPFRK